MRAPRHDDTVLARALVGRARNAIAQALDLPTAAEPRHPALDSPGATFVTLRLGGELRGCVGTLAAERALGDDVRVHALAAAFRDSRFEPLRVEEFAELEIEVSLLEPAQPVAARTEAEAHQALRPGVDGVLLEWRGRSATFLPQVWEQLPLPAEFLGALKRKAGLAADFWHHDLRLSRYRVRKFAQIAAARHERARRRGRFKPSRRAGGTGSTTAGCSATCARATAGCTKASAGCASCASASAMRWC